MRHATDPHLSQTFSTKLSNSFAIRPVSPSECLFRQAPARSPGPRIGGCYFRPRVRMRRQPIPLLYEVVQHGIGIANNLPSRFLRPNFPSQTAPGAKGGWAPTAPMTASLGHLQGGWIGGAGLVFLFNAQWDRFMLSDSLPPLGEGSLQLPVLFLLHFAVFISAKNGFQPANPQTRWIFLSRGGKVWCSRHLKPSLSQVALPFEAGGGGIDGSDRQGPH